MASVNGIGKGILLPKKLDDSKVQKTDKKQETEEATPVTEEPSATPVEKPLNSETTQSVLQISTVRPVSATSESIVSARLEESPNINDLQNVRQIAEAARMRARTESIVDLLRDLAVSWNEPMANSVESEDADDLATPVDIIAPGSVNPAETKPNLDN